jgi:hypothetical protein
VSAKYDNFQPIPYTYTWTLPPNSFFLGWNIAPDAQFKNEPVGLQPVYVSFRPASWNDSSAGAQLMARLGGPAAAKPTLAEPAKPAPSPHKKA